MPRRTLMVGADLFRTTVAVALAASTGSVAVAYAAAFGLSAGAAVFNPAAAALLPDVVGTDELVDANSALWTAAVTVQIALAPLAGLVIAVFGVEISFLVNAATFVASALLLSRLRAGRTAAEPTRRSRGDVLAGARTILADPLLTRLAVVQIIA